MAQENTTYTTQKSNFQRIYSIAEDFIGKLKGMYPLNYSHIIRANYYTLLVYVISTLSLCAAMYMTSSIVWAIVITIVGAAYPFIFLLGEKKYNDNLEISDEENPTEKSGDVFNNRICEIISQLDTLADYPDVEKYRDDFSKRAFVILNEKQTIKKRFNRVYGTTKTILGLVFMLTFAYPFIIEQPSMLAERIVCIADIQPGTPHFTISSFCGDGKIDDKTLDFYVSPIYLDPTTGTHDGIKICARNVSIPDAQPSDKIYCAITDKNGVPLKPELAKTFIRQDIDAFGIHFRCSADHETITLLNYLKDHQKDLKLLVERW